MKPINADDSLVISNARGARVIKKLTRRLCDVAELVVAGEAMTVMLEKTPEDKVAVEIGDVPRQLDSEDIPDYIVTFFFTAAAAGFAGVKYEIVEVHGDGTVDLITTTIRYVDQVDYAQTVN